MSRLPSIDFRREHAPARVESGQDSSSVDTLWSAMSDLRTRVDDLIGSWPFEFDLRHGVCDIEETDDAYLVEFDLAGVKRNDVEVTTNGRRLTVRGERREKERTGFLRRRDRTVGTFHYDVVLPGDIDPDEVTAGMEDGVLTVRLAKPERDRARRIAISAGPSES